MIVLKEAVLEKTKNVEPRANDALSDGSSKGQLSVSVHSSLPVSRIQTCTVRPRAYSILLALTANPALRLHVYISRNSIWKLISRCN